MVALPSFSALTMPSASTETTVLSEVVNLHSVGATPQSSARTQRTSP